MRSLILSSALFCTVFAAPPARAAELVTTSETDGGEPDWDVVIVQPLDGDSLVGSPDATVTLIVEFDPYFLGSVQTQVDDEDPVPCDLEPCQRELVLAPGQHVIRASHEWDETSITVTVHSSSEETEGAASEGSDSEGSESEGPEPTGEATETEGSEPTGSGSAGSDGAPATDTDTTGEGGSDGADSDGSGGEKGCGCKAEAGAPGLLALAVLALLAPRRRRR